MATLVLPEYALGVLEPSQMFLVTLIYSIVIIGFSFLMYKLLPKEFFKLTKGKTIATVILFLISFLSQVYLLFTVKFNIIKIINLLLGSAANLLALFLFVSSFIFLYYKIRDKKIFKNKKELILSILIILFLNGWTLSILMFILMASANILFFAPVACGLTVVFTETSPALDAGIKINETIVAINGNPINDITNLIAVLEEAKPGDEITVKTDADSYKVKLVPNPDNPTLPFLGVIPESKHCDN